MSLTSIFLTQLYLIGLSAPAAIILQSVSRMDEINNRGDMMHSMLLGSAILVGVQIVLVLVAFAWYRRSTDANRSPRP